VKVDPLHSSYATESTIHVATRKKRGANEEAVEGKAETLIPDSASDLPKTKQKMQQMNMEERRARSEK